MASPIPNVSFSFPENGLGIQPSSPSGVIAVIGASSLGTAAIPARKSGGAGNVSSAFGYGPMPHGAANLVQSGAEVVCVKCAHTAATVGAVTKTGAGASIMTVTGTPIDRYDVLVTIVRAGTVETDLTGQITVSFDGGRTTSKPITIPIDGEVTVFAAMTGLTLVFAAGTVIVGNTYTFQVPAPTVSAASVVAALQALKASTQTFSMVWVAGAAFSAADCATISDEHATFIARKKFSRLLLSSVDETSDTEAEWMAALQEDFADFETPLTTVSAGYIGVRDVLTGFVPWRPNLYLMANRAAQVAIQRDLGAVADGALTPYLNASNATADVPLPASAFGTKFVHDENLVPGLNADRFATIQTHEGLSGYFVTNPNLMAGPTSDYDLLQFGRVADEVARITNIYFTQQLSDDVQLNPATGRILEKKAKSLESGNDSALAGLFASGATSAAPQTSVSREDNIITTKTLTVSVSLVPKGYLKAIVVTIQFTPTLSA